MRRFQKCMKNGILMLVMAACLTVTAGAAAAPTDISDTAAAAEEAASETSVSDAAASDTAAAETAASDEAAAETATSDKAAADSTAAETADSAVSETAASDEQAADGTVVAPNASGGVNGRIQVDLVEMKEGYSAVLYDSSKGLPTSEANAIAETSEGFIWIGSYSGLIRYDGNTFVRMDSSTGIASVKCLFVDRDDRLWIGTNDSGLFVMEHGEFRNWDENSGLKASSVRAIVQGSDGTIYIATTNGISAIDPDLNLRDVDDSALRERFIHDLRLGSDDVIYGIDNAGDIFTLENGKPAHYLTSQNESDRFSNAILPDPSSPGHLYLASGDSTVYYCHREGNSLVDLDVIDLSPLNQVQRFEYINGQIWICCRNGIGVLNSDGLHVLENLPMDNFIVNVMTDYAGNLWFASSRQGVMKIVPNRFSDLFERFDLEEAVVNSTCKYGNRLFIGSDKGLTVLEGDRVLQNLPLTQAVTAGGVDLETKDLLEMLEGTRIRSILRDSRNRLWISAWHDPGLILYDGEKVTAFTVEDGLLSERVRAVCERSDGSIAAATSGGVNIIKDGRVTAEYSEEHGIANSEILTVAEGMDGDLLIGTDGGGIYILGKDGTTRHIGRAQGLTSEVILRIKRDTQKDFFWVITGTSLACMNSEYELTTLNRFPYPNNFDLFENSRGEMWILSSDGIYVCPKEDLLANGAMNPFHYSISDGLPCVATANSYSGITENGDLYIAGISGVTKVNIEASFDQIKDLKAAVPYIDVDGSRVYPDSSGSFVIPSSAQKLTIYSYVFNYSLIDPKISYHLEGFDKEEETVFRSELDPVDYTNLRGGTYHFVLRIQDFMGHESRTVSVRIIKEKAVYEYPLFYAAVLLLALGFIVWNARRYTRKKLDALEKEHREKAEKERLHSELQMAAALQDSMLPTDYPPFPDRGEFDIFASMDPAREVGGDFYDYFLIDDDHLCLTIADVSGKGIPAALFMMVSKVILQSVARVGKPVEEILQEANASLCRDNKLEMFVTVWIGILEISTGIIRAANAGHEYPAVMKDGRFSLFKDRHGFVVGGMEGSKYRAYEMRLEPGDKLFVYTDGLPEATDTSNKLFGTDRMIEALNADPDASPEIIINNLYKAVGGFVKNAEQFDDLTMLCLEYKGPAGRK